MAWKKPADMNTQRVLEEVKKMFEEVNIEIRGGVIQDVRKTGNVKVIVIDYDNDPTGNRKDEW